MYWSQKTGDGRRKLKENKVNQELEKYKAIFRLRTSDFGLISNKILNVNI
jgi:hypothetical protein